MVRDLAYHFPGLAQRQWCPRRRVLVARRRRNDCLDFQVSLTRTTTGCRFEGGVLLDSLRPRRAAPIECFMLAIPSPHAREQQGVCKEKDEGAESKETLVVLYDVEGQPDSGGRGALDVGCGLGFSGFRQPRAVKNGSELQGNTTAGKDNMAKFKS
jgi:hypothetical protein